MPTLATSEATQAFLKQAPGVHPDNHRKLGVLSVNALGIGTYLGDTTEAFDRRSRQAIVHAVGKGINLIDTSINYRCQRSERTIGEALKDLIAPGKVRRESLVICTKGGYVPFDQEPPRSRAEFTDYLEKIFFEPGVADPRDFVDQQHCMSPGYLRHQFGQSLKNLGLDAIDVYYIHNPEGQLSSVKRETFMERMRAAFVELEGKVRMGQLRYYGTATWSGYRVGPDKKNHLSLEALVELAEECAGEKHHFKVVQLPCSLSMNEAWSVPTQTLGGKPVTFMEAANQLGIAVVFSGTMSQGKLSYGLPPKLVPVLGGATDAERALRFAISVPGVSCALSGMSQVAHVDENARAVAQPPADLAPLEGQI